MPVLLQERVLPICCLARAVVSTPLCERQAVCTVELVSLLQWRECAAAQSRETRDELAEDGGPTARELLVRGSVGADAVCRSLLAVSVVHTLALLPQKELDWLLDDAVEACCGPGAQRCRAWRDVQRCPAGRAEGCSVTLRAQLQDLGELWHRRLQHRYAPRSAFLPGRRCGAAPAQRLAVCRTPLQYLCNVAHWRGTTLAVGPGVLIPRPETELLIEFAQEVRPRLADQRRSCSGLAYSGAAHTQALQRHPDLCEGAWADLGTGSGALAVGLASVLPPGSPVLAVECSPDARAWAQLNVQRLGLASAVEVRGAQPS